MQGMKQVFSFTLARQTESKGWRGITITLCLLLFLLPAVILPCVEYFGGNEPIPEPELPPHLMDDTFIPLVTAPDILYMVDDSTGTPTDLSFLTALPGYEHLTIVPCADLDAAAAQSAGQPRALIVFLSENNGAFALDVLLPDGCALTDSDAYELASVIANAFPQLLALKAGVAPETALALQTPIVSTVTSDSSFDAGDPLADVRELLGMLLPYVNIMLIYFLVLFYGQGVANSVILEKTSKLMDSFLVAVKPRAMIFGKVFAIWLGSVIQFLLWVLSVAAGFAVGIALVKAINPSSTMGILLFFDFVGGISGVFTLSGAIVAVLMILAGFLLYCAIAAIGGALAGKPEDLSSTNLLFTLILIVSFFTTLQSGFLDGNVRSGVGWMDLVPFTAILITPSRILLGNVPVWTGLAALLLTVALTALLVALAGKLYQMMALYKGNLPKPRQILQMLKNK